MRTDVSADAGPPRERTARRSTAVVLGAWLVLIGFAFAWGRWLTTHGRWPHVHTPPLYGDLVPRFGVLAIPAVVLGVLGIVFLPRFAATTPWLSLLVCAAIGGGLWAASLAAMDGGRGFIATPSSRLDYRGTVPLISSPLAFVAHYTRDLARFSIHAHGHPPGMVLLLWLMARTGLAGPQWEAALYLSGFSLAIPAVLVAAKEVAGEAAARAAVPFLVLAPFAAQGVAITADAVYAAVSAWAIALIVLATGRAGRRADALALAGGLLFGLALYGSYGLVVLAVIPLIVAISRRRVRPLMIAAIGGAVVAAAFLAFGFWWIAGLRATMSVIDKGARRFRTPLYFTYANVAIFALVIGPSVVVALTRLRERAVWLLTGGGLAAVAIADVSQLSRAEVERIWLPMAIWVAIAASALARRAVASRPWLALHAATGLLLACTIRSIW